MSGPVAIVTGASRGLGAATARILADLGARVVINARSQDDLAEVASHIKQAGGEAVPFAGDISDPEVCERLVTTAIDHFGQIDALVNNAAILEPLARLARAEAHEWQRALMINIVGPVLAIQAALPHLREANGRVINVSSGAAIKPKVGWGAYCTSKAALNMVNATLAEEEPTITAVAVRPGIVDTEMQAVIRQQGEGHMTDDDYARFVGHYEKGELQPPDKPGRALAVLALYAPHNWSGEFVEWTDDRVLALIERHGRA